MSFLFNFEKSSINFPTKSNFCTLRYVFIFQQMSELEDNIGFQFKNIRLLAKAFTHNVTGLQDKNLTK